jgi:hypothetical protein
MILDGLSDEDIQFFGSNNFFQFGFKSRFGFETIREDNLFIASPNIEYKYNSMGYRSQEFSPKCNILISGCSHSFGLGVPQNETWADILSKNINSEYQNISVVGGAINTIVQNIFAYIKKFGNPKNIFILFPDLNRIHLPNINNILNNENYFGFNFAYANEFGSDVASERPKFSKIPHKISDVFPNESILYINCHSILNLEMYCKEAGINLIYSIWGKNSINIIKKIKEKNKQSFLNFIEVDIYKFKRYNSLEKTNIDDPECHQEYKDIWGERYFYAEDHYKNYIGHFNSHMHMHIAESFLKENNDY